MRFHCILSVVLAMGRMLHEAESCDDASPGDSSGEQQAPYCCCSEEEPDPKYICYNTKDNTVHLPPMLDKAKLLKQLKGMHGVGVGSPEPIAFPAKKETTSTCKGDQAQVIEAEKREVTPLFKDAQELASTKWGNVPEFLRKGGYLAYRSRLNGPVQLLNNTHFMSGDFKKMHAVYQTYLKSHMEYGKSNEHLAPHVEYNNVIYGPTKQMGSFDLHGQVLCDTFDWEATQGVKHAESGKLSGKLQKSKSIGWKGFDARKNQWQYKTTCAEPIEIMKCRQWTVAHACGYEGSDTWLLKRVGRKGSCEMVSKKKPKCPSKMYHSYVWHPGFHTLGMTRAEGGMQLKYCDCGGVCEAEVEKLETQPPPPPPERNPFASAATEPEHDDLVDGDDVPEHEREAPFLSDLVPESPAGAAVADDPEAVSMGS